MKIRDRQILRSLSANIYLLKEKLYLFLYLPLPMWMKCAKIRCFIARGSHDIFKGKGGN